MYYILKKQYKKLALIYHPDKNNGNSRQFELLKDAYVELVSKLREKGKYKSIRGIAAISVLSLLQKAVGIVENTEEYTEYLLYDTFSDKDAYNKVPPGTIRIFSPNLICFFNGRTWRKLK